MAGVLNVVGALTRDGGGDDGRARASSRRRSATQHVVVAALLSAIAWNLVTWRAGIPSESSHALVFSIVGAGVAARRGGRDPGRRA